MPGPPALTPLVDDLAAAARAGDHDAFRAAGQRLADAVGGAERTDLDAAVRILTPVLDQAPLSLGGTLAQYVGSLIGMDGDPAPALATLVDHACRAMEDTRVFIALHEELVGPVPERRSCGPAEYERFTAAAVDRHEDPGSVAEGWMSAESWVQPVLFLCQRADVRRALPQRERLLSAAVGAEDDLPDLAPWLVGLLRVLDDEPLIVLHRPSRTGFRGTMTGVADNFQLHTLIAAAVVPALPVPRRGLFRRRAAASDLPTPAMVAAADGSGDLAPGGGIVGQFDLVDATAAAIWNEGRPDTIPLVDGARLVVLDPPSYTRAWDVGRDYPLLRAKVELTPLPADETDAWLTRVAPPLSPYEKLARAQEPTWAEDMSVPLPPGRTVADAVDVVLALAAQGVARVDLEAAVAREFALSPEDAALAIDRVLAGAVRAASGNPANRPDPTRDPIADESYRRAAGA